MLEAPRSSAAGREAVAPLVGGLASEGEPSSSDAPLGAGPSALGGVRFRARVGAGQGRRGGESVRWAHAPPKEFERTLEGLPRLGTDFPRWGMTRPARELASSPRRSHVRWRFGMGSGAPAGDGFDGAMAWNGHPVRAHAAVGRGRPPLSSDWAVEGGAPLFVRHRRWRSMLDPGLSTLGRLPGGAPRPELHPWVGVISQILGRRSFAGLLFPPGHSFRK